MSKTSQQSLMIKVLDFFVELYSPMGWEFDDPSLYSQNCTIEGTTNVLDSRSVGLWLKLAIVKGFIVLSDMKLEAVQGVKLLSPEDFLKYHGKVLYAKASSKESYWRIAAPKDLDAFFEGYDRLASRLGYQTLFT
jgi:hypothetical protein